MADKPIMLDLGCGKNKYAEHYIGIDKSPDVGADIVMNFAINKLPYGDCTVSGIYTAHTIEHLTDKQAMFFMNEYWRVLKWGGKMWIHVPHMKCKVAWQDPTHQSFWIREKFKFFCGHYLKKYDLDYPINCIFRVIKDDLEYPNGKDKADYFTKIHMGLLKNKEHFNKYKDSFPFNKQVTGVTNKSQFTPQDEDPAWFLNTRWQTEHNCAFSDKAKKVAKRAINTELGRIIAIKVDASKRYGEDAAHLGLRGIFADINRKHKRLKQFLWEGEIDTSENVEDTLSDMAVYAILGLMELDERRKDGRTDS